MMGKSRRTGDGGHTEVTLETVEKGSFEIIELLLWSMAMVDVEFFYPVMCVLVGARTKWHTDSFYGGTYNAARFLARGGFLVLDYRIPFRQCVVQYEGRFFVPMSLGNRNGPVLRMLELLSEGGCEYDETFSREWLYSDEVTLVGYLPYLVMQKAEKPEVEWADGKYTYSGKIDATKQVGIVPEYYKCNPDGALLYGTAQITYISTDVVIKEAQRTTVRPPQ